MSTDLEPRSPMAPSILSDDEIRRSWRIAEALAASGMFPDARKAEQAFSKMLVGHDLGLSPTQALMSVHLVEGKPQIAAAQLAAFVRQHPDYDYRIAVHDETICSIDFYRTGEDVPLGTSTFTIEDAGRAGLVKAKGAWEKYPANMLFARAMSNGVRWFAPDAAGGVPVYTEGDEFDRQRLSDGMGGQPAGLDLGPKVEAVLERATSLGHAGLADRGSAEITLGGRSPDVAVEWVKQAEAQLDDYEASQIAKADELVADAEVVAEPAEQVAEARRMAEKLEGEAKVAEHEGDAEGAEQLRKGAAEFLADAEKLEVGA